MIYIKKEFAKSHAMHACMPTWFLCQCGLRINMAKVHSDFTYQRANKRAYVFQLGVPHTKWHDNFFIWHVNMPESVPIFQIFLL